MGFFNDILQRYYGFNAQKEIIEFQGNHIQELKMWNAVQHAQACELMNKMLEMQDKTSNFFQKGMDILVDSNARNSENEYKTLQQRAALMRLEKAESKNLPPTPAPTPFLDANSESPNYGNYPPLSPPLFWGKPGTKEMITLEFVQPELKDMMTVNVDEQKNTITFFAKNYSDFDSHLSCHSLANLNSSLPTKIFDVDKSFIYAKICTKCDHRKIVISNNQKHYCGKHSK